MSGSLAKGRSPGRSLPWPRNRQGLPAGPQPCPPPAWLPPLRCKRILPWFSAVKAAASRRGASGTCLPCPANLRVPRAKAATLTAADVQRLRAIRASPPPCGPASLPPRAPRLHNNLHRVRRGEAAQSGRVVAAQQKRPGCHILSDRRSSARGDFTFPRNAGCVGGACRPGALPQGQGAYPAQKKTSLQRRRSQTQMHVQRQPEGSRPRQWPCPFAGKAMTRAGRFFGCDLPVLPPASGRVRGPQTRHPGTSGSARQQQALVGTSGKTTGRRCAGRIGWPVQSARPQSDRSRSASRNLRSCSRSGSRRAT